MYEKKRPPIQEGKVLWFDPLKGYGFIERPNDSDLFVHFSDIIALGREFQRLYDGQDVRYRVGIGPRGEYAYNVFPCRKWFYYKAGKTIVK